MLVNSLDVLFPNLTPKLVGTDALLDLKALASNLPPILRGGFECRLTANTSQVDLQQCIVQDDIELLREHIITSANRVHPGWLQLSDFLNEWRTSLKSIPEIWLEFDINSSSVPIPAIFVGLPQKISPAYETYEIAVHSLNLLLPSAWSEWQDNLYRCFAACPNGIFVSHIGVMLSRNTPALRVNIKRLQANSLVPYLQQLGWQQQSNEVETLMRQLCALCERITVCLDVGQHIYPQIGLECIFLQQLPHESRWAVFLDYLIECGLCEPQKREALLNWPGQSNPLNSLAPWPEHLISASLLEPKEHFTVFERRLSHIKVVWQPQRQLEAKAYLWFEHRWLSIES